MWLMAKTRLNMVRRLSGKAMESKNGISFDPVISHLKMYPTNTAAPTQQGQWHNIPLCRAHNGKSEMRLS
jgi:hypothetical protein